MFLSNLLDSPTPTVFEMAMAGSLSKGLQPAFNYLLQVLSDRHPWAFKAHVYKDETFALFLLFVEHHFLSRSHASFAENFYGLKRAIVIPTTSITAAATAASASTEVPTGALSAKHKLGSLVALVLGPYVWGKAAAWALQQRTLDTPQQQEKHISSIARVKQQLRLIARTVLPLGLAVQGVGAMLLQILFMFKRTPYYSPSLWLLGVTVVRQTSEDVKREAMMSAATASTKGAATGVGRILGLISRMREWLLTALRTALISSALIFKVVEWYFSPENQSQRDSLRMAQSQVLPPPPLPPIACAGSEGIAANASLCPLCGDPRQNPAASSSGVVFCYTCIHRFVREHGRCPVTGAPCAVLQIRRVFGI